MDTQGPIRVAVLSPYALVRAGLTTLVHSEGPRAIVVDSASSDGHLGDVDVVIYDLGGLAVPTTRSDLRHLVPLVPVVGLVREGRSDIADGARALGVRSFIPETVSPEDLLRALESVSGRRAASRRPVAISSVLSEREQTVLTLVAEGKSNRDIAGELFLSVNSIKTYIRTSYRKIGVHTRTQAVLWAVQHGLVSRDRLDLIPAED